MNISEQPADDDDDELPLSKITIDPAAARELYTVNYPFMEADELALKSYKPGPSELATLASRLFPSILSWRRSTSSSEKTAQPSIEEVSREAVHAALQIAKTIREGADMQLFLERQLRAGYEEEAPKVRAKEEELRLTVWEPLVTAHRKRHKLPKHAPVEKIDLDIYLTHVMPKVRGRDQERRARFAAFRRAKWEKDTRRDRDEYAADLARFEELEADVERANKERPNEPHGHDFPRPVWRPEWDRPTDEAMLAPFTAGVPFGTVNWQHDLFQKFCLEWVSQRKKEGGSKGGKAPKNSKTPKTPPAIKQGKVSKQGKTHKAPPASKRGRYP